MMFVRVQLIESKGKATRAELRVGRLFRVPSLCWRTSPAVSWR